MLEVLHSPGCALIPLPRAKGILVAAISAPRPSVLQFINSFSAAAPKFDDAIEERPAGSPFSDMGFVSSYFDRPQNKH
jgi:hypothetical protein